MSEAKAPKKTLKLGFGENFLLSGTAAAVSKTAAAPIERVKMLIQNQEEMIKQVKKWHIANYSVQ